MCGWLVCWADLVGDLIADLIVCRFDACLFLLGRFVGFSWVLGVLICGGDCCVDFVVFRFIMLFAVVCVGVWFFCLWLCALLDLFGVWCRLLTLTAV